MSIGKKFVENNSNRCKFEKSENRRDWSQEMFQRKCLHRAN